MSVTIRDAGVDVQISKETRAPSQQGFGALGFVNPVLAITDRVKLFTEMSEVQAIYPFGTETYAAASFWYAQNPRPSDFYVIQMLALSVPTPATGTMTFAGVATASGDYEMSIDSVKYTVDTLVGPVTAVSAAGSVDLSASPNAMGDGDIDFDIDGTVYSIAPLAGDDATQMGDELAAAINGGATHSAVNIVGMVTVTDTNAGVAGNSVVFGLSITDTGATGVLQQPIGGIDAVAGSTAETLAAQLASEISAGTTHTATAALGVLTIVDNIDGTVGDAVILTEDLAIAGITSVIVQPIGGANLILSETVPDALAAAVLINPDFYAVALHGGIRTDLTEMAATADWVEANERLFFACTNDSEVTDSAITTDIASLFQATGYQRTYLHYGTTLDEYPEIGAFALLATTQFRGTNTLKTLKFKEVALATTEELTSSVLATIRDKNCNVIFTTAGIKMIDAGRTCGGGWIDEIHGADALAEEIRVRVFGLLARTSTKIPYTEQGMAQIKAEVTGALSQYERNGYLAAAIDADGTYLDAFTVSSGLVSQASQIDKAARIAPNVEFTGRLAGAIHSVTITGKLTL